MDCLDQVCVWLTSMTQVKGDLLGWFFGHKRSTYTQVNMVGIFWFLSSFTGVLSYFSPGDDKTTWNFIGYHKFLCLKIQDFHGVLTLLSLSPTFMNFERYLVKHEFFFLWYFAWKLWSIYLHCHVAVTVAFNDIPTKGVNSLWIVKDKHGLILLLNIQHWLRSH